MKKSGYFLIIPAAAVVITARIITLSDIYRSEKNITNIPETTVCEYSETVFPAAPLKSDISNLYYYGTIYDNSFENYKHTDDKGMFSCPKGIVYLDTDNDSESYSVILFTPVENALNFVLSDEIDGEDESISDTILDIVRNYYPNIMLVNKKKSDNNLLVKHDDNKKYTLYLRKEWYNELSSEEAEELSQNIRHDLEEKGLIKEFYSWGQMAHYKRVEFFGFTYSVTAEQYDEMNEYLAKSYPTCKPYIKPEESSDNICCSLYFHKLMNKEEKFEIVFELYEKLKISPVGFCYE